MAGRTIACRLAIASVAIVVASVCLAAGVHGAVPAYAALSAGWQGDTTGTVAAQASKKAGTYKVVFKANGGKGKMKAQKANRGKRVALRANKFKRSGYKFAGWNTKRNGKGKSYKNKAKVKNLAKEGKTVKLYAQWKKTSRVDMWVVTKKHDTGFAGDSLELGYKYNKSGLVVRESGYYDGGYNTYKYAYNSAGALKSCKQTGGWKTSYSLDNRGRVIARLFEDSGERETYKYNKKGQLVSYNGIESKYSYNYNGKGQLKARVQKMPISGKTKTFRVTYAYDSKGSIASVNTDSGTYKWTNTYKNDLLVKTELLRQTITYKYKKVSVPRKFVKMVKAQQFSIVAGLLPFEAAHK